MKDRGDMGGGGRVLISVAEGFMEIRSVCGGERKVMNEQRPAERPFFCTFSRRLDVDVLIVEDGRTRDAKTCYHFKCRWFPVTFVRTISSLLQTGVVLLPRLLPPPPVHLFWWRPSINKESVLSFLFHLLLYYLFTHLSTVMASMYVARSGWTISF